MLRYAIFLSLLLLAACGNSRSMNAWYLSKWDHIDDLANRVDTTAHKVQQAQLIGAPGQLLTILTELNAHERCPVTGEVLVGFIVDETGRVAETQVYRGLHPDCDEVSQQAVRALRFQPTLVDGRPVKMALSMPIRYRQYTLQMQ